jgi:hypothetical protein
MASSIEYRRYMDECLRAAAKAASDEERKSLLQLAQIWHQSATNLEARAGLVEENDDEPAGQPATAGTVNSWEAPNEP